MLHKLYHRENILRHELGLTPSARANIRIGGTKKEQENAVDAALFGGKPAWWPCDE